jgi:bis(5'-nucleosyl)-tetraphosphatase (symmetrical)
MVHAGLLPQWSLAQAQALAREAERALAGPRYREFLGHLFGNEPYAWHDALAGYDRLRVIINAMTRMRIVGAKGALEFKHKTGLADLPRGYVPWYDVPGRASRDARIIFGHWAALGLLQRDDVTCLDTGCVWGRELSALRLEDRRLFQRDCPELQGTASGE